jgi:hypothetical protein
MDEPRIRAATASDVSVARQIVAEAYRHYIARIGRPPAPMLDDYHARISEGMVWVIEEGAGVAGIIVLKPQPEYLLLDNIAVSPARQGAGFGGCWPSRRQKRCAAAIARSASIPTGQ